MLSFLASLAAIVGGYLGTKRFVLNRLRYVDAATDPAAPWVAGAAGTVAGLPFALLPILTVGTAVSLGAGIGWGVYRAGRELARRLPPG